MVGLSQWISSQKLLRRNHRLHFHALIVPFIMGVLIFNLSNTNLKIRLLS